MSKERDTSESNNSHLQDCVAHRDAPRQLGQGFEFGRPTTKPTDSTRQNIVDAGDTDEWNGDQDTGNRRADNTHQIHTGGVERDRIGELIFLTDYLRFE